MERHRDIIREYLVEIVWCIVVILINVWLFCR